MRREARIPLFRLLEGGQCDKLFSAVFAVQRVARAFMLQIMA
jgi:hypothetical protein